MAISPDGRPGIPPIFPAISCLPTIVGERPEVLLIGTGERHVMLSREVLDPLLRAGIGVECMSTPAAARTYNVLMAEDRLVIAALLP